MERIETSDVPREIACAALIAASNLLAATEEARDLGNPGEAADRLVDLANAIVVSSRDSLWEKPRRRSTDQGT